MENRTQKFCSIPLLFFQRFDHGTALKIERKMPHLNIAFDRYTSIVTVMHYILVISAPYSLQTNAAFTHADLTTRYRMKSFYKHIFSHTIYSL